MKDKYEVVHTINLPFLEQRKEPGAFVTKGELERAHQTDDDVKRLIRDKAIKETS